MQASVLPAAGLGLLGLVTVFGGVPQGGDGQRTDVETTVVRLPDQGSAAWSDTRDHPARRPPLPDTRADDDRPVRMPEVEPRRPGPVPMPEVEPRHPGPVPMPEAGSRDPVLVPSPADWSDDPGRGGPQP
jgi:hypothetical protein